MRLEFGAVFANLPALGQAEHLVPAAVGEHGPIPPDEPVQAAETPNQFITGTKVEVIGVAQNDLGAGLLEVFEERPFHRSLRPDRHERRRTHHAVRSDDLAKTRSAVAAEHGEAELIAQDVYYDSQA